MHGEVLTLHDYKGELAQAGHLKRFPLPNFGQRIWQGRSRRLFGHPVVCLIHGKTIEEHDTHLKAVLKRVKESGLKLNKEKCQIRKTQLTYFGHSNGQDSVKPMPDKVMAIQELPPPKSVIEL